VETNGRDNGRGVTYTYDALNRISTATSQATSGSDCWGQSFGYDRYANLTTINVTQCTAPALSLSVNTNNQITNSGFTYDAAGDLTADGVYSYSWNAEAHLTTSSGVTSTYDGDLKRVKKSNGVLYWYCATCGKVLAESDLSGNLTSEYAFFNKQRIARRDVASGNVYYLFRDRLGSYRTLTDSAGNVKGESDYYPFGAERVISSTATDSFRFAGMEWDSEDGLNHTLYRQHTPAQGRWETPDPKRGRLNFPQGQNLYAYVMDNPATSIDPLGLMIWKGPGGEGAGGGDCDPCVDLGCGCDPSDASCSGDTSDCGGGGGGGGGGTGQCTAWYSAEGQAMSLDLCKDHPDHPVLQYSWQCSSEAPNSIDCCLDKAEAASQYCYKPHEGIFFEQLPTGAGNKYGCCCGKTKNQIRPPVRPGQPY
jgi:RHS repeat-associated protein